MGKSLTKTPWRIALEKRVKKQERMVALALLRLEGGDTHLVELPTPRRLGIHFGLLALAQSSPKVVDIRERARWILRWLLSYLIDQDYTVADLTSNEGLAALEAIAVIAGTAKSPPSQRIQIATRGDRALMLYSTDGTSIDAQWQEIYRDAWQFINALGEVAR